jgi:hypothetical protein
MTTWFSLARGVIRQPISLDMSIGEEQDNHLSDVIEDRLFGIKSREFYEAPTPTIASNRPTSKRRPRASTRIRQLRSSPAGCARSATKAGSGRPIAATCRRSCGKTPS